LSRHRRVGPSSRTCNPPSFRLIGGQMEKENIKYPTPVVTRHSTESECRDPVVRSHHQQSGRCVRHFLLFLVLLRQSKAVSRCNGDTTGSGERRCVSCSRGKISNRPVRCKPPHAELVILGEKLCLSTSRESAGKRRKRKRWGPFVRESDKQQAIIHVVGQPRRMCTSPQRIQARQGLTSTT
jgi:hypothetical protein